MKKLHLLSLDTFPILTQLQLEEALLRLSEDNFCILNQGSQPTFVMGISGDEKKLFHESPYSRIRRFSGGGAVLIDEGTLLVSFIGNHSLLEEEISPNQLHEWAFPYFQKALLPTPLHLQENDYCIGEKKVGGNAQSITRNRFVHHTSLLWNFSEERMNLLKIPQKVPAYRKNRNHREFVCRLSQHIDSPKTIFSQLIEALGQKYTLVETKKEDLFPLLALPHRKSTSELPIQKLTF